MKQFLYGVNPGEGTVVPLVSEEEGRNFANLFILTSCENSREGAVDELVVKTEGKEELVALKNNWKLLPVIKLFQDRNGYHGEVSFIDFAGNQIIKKYRSCESVFPVDRKQVIEEIVALIERMSDFNSVLDAELHLIIAANGKDSRPALQKDLETLCRIRELYDIFLDQQMDGELNDKLTDKLKEEFRFILNQIGERLVAL